MTRQINRQGLDILRSSESCELRAYPDPGTGGDPWTIGWGDTSPDVVPGLVITQEEADARLAQKLRYFESGVARLVTAPISGNQFSALVCFAYNCGIGPDGLGGSSLLRKLNAGDYAGAAAQFARWNKSDGKVMRGLVARRYKERTLFLTPGDGDDAS